MISSHNKRTLRSEKTYIQNIHPKMSVSAENSTNLSEPYGAKEIDANDDGFSPELIEERIKANLELLNDYILTRTQLLNQLIQDNSAKITPTAGSRTQRPQTGPSRNRETGVSITSPDSMRFSFHVIILDYVFGFTDSHPWSCIWFQGYIPWSTMAHWYHAMVIECFSAWRAMSFWWIMDDYLWMVNLGIISVTRRLFFTGCNWLFESSLSGWLHIYAEFLEKDLYTQNSAEHEFDIYVRPNKKSLWPCLFLILS